MLTVPIAYDDTSLLEPGDRVRRPDKPSRLRVRRPARRRS
jgi:hypothetical protein